MKECFPEDPIRQLKPKLVAVNDKASLVEVVDKGDPAMQKL